MIACDTSSLIAFLKGETGKDVTAINAALTSAELVLPPATLTELLSNPRTSAAATSAISGLTVLDTRPDYWRRVAAIRSTIISKGLEARLADALIAQSCIDEGIKLITRDRDFRHFAAHCGLQLA
jgi:predicted nucleic acid-binding protein